MGYLTEGPRARQRRWGTAIDGVGGKEPAAARHAEARGSTLRSGNAKANAAYQALQVIR